MSKSGATVNVKGTSVTVVVHEEQDHIPSTDIAKHKSLTAPTV